MTNHTAIHMYENKSQSSDTGVSKMHKHGLSLAHGLYYSLYLRKTCIFTDLGDNCGKSGNRAAFEESACSAGRN